MLRKILQDCHEATHISVLKENGQRLSIQQKIHYNVHVFFCQCCKGYLKHSKTLNEVLELQKEKMNTKPPFQLSEKIKAEIRKHISSENT